MHALFITERQAAAVAEEQVYGQQTIAHTRMTITSDLADESIASHYTVSMRDLPGEPLLVLQSIHCHAIPQKK